MKQNLFNFKKGILLLFIFLHFLPVNAISNVYLLPLTRSTNENTSGLIAEENHREAFSTLCSGMPDTSSILGVDFLCSGNSTLLTLSNTYLDDGMTYQWAYSNVSGGPYINMGTNADQSISSLTTSTFYVCTITCSNSGLSFTTMEKLVTVNPLPLISVSQSSTNYCIPGGTSVNLNASNAISYDWSPSTGLNTTVNANVLASPSVTTIYTVVGTDANGCTQSVTNIIVNVYPVPVVTAPNVSACGGMVSLGGTPVGGLWNLPNPYAGAATSYTYYFTDTNGCTGSAIASISSFSANITGVNVTNITGVSASINYSAVAGIGWYELRWKPLSSGMWTVGTNNNSTIKNLTNLTPNTTYEVQIRGFCSTSNPGNWSASNLFTTTNTCGTPTNLGIINIGATSGTATWTSIQNASYYSVRFRVSPNGAWSILTSNGVSLLLPNLQTNTLYDVQIATVCGTTYSPYSTTVNFTTGTGCLTPTGMIVTNITGTSAKLNWNASSGAIYYGIRYKKTSVNTWSTSTSTGTSKTVNALVVATPYEFQVQTVCSSTSSSSWSASTLFTTATSKSNSVFMEDESINDVFSFRCYPNPTSDFLNIDFVQTDISSLKMKIVDMSGRVLKEMQFETVSGHNHYETDLTDLLPGIYSIQVCQEGREMKSIRITKN